MGLLGIVITLMVIGVLLYLIERYIPMDAGIKTLLRIVVIIIVAIWVLQSLGVLGSVTGHSHVDDVRIR